MLLLGLALASTATAQHVPARPPDLPRATVVHVTDGDTITVHAEGRSVRVRLIGVDTPELHNSRKLDRDAARRGASRRTIQVMGAEAARYTHTHLLGREVGLEYDVTRTDRYGRTLAYVWMEDGRLFNAELLRAGLARTVTIPPNVRHAPVFAELQREARAARRGFWRTREP